MPEMTAELYEKIKTLAKTPKPDFLELADHLRDLCQDDKKTFASLWAEKSRVLTRRKAIYLRDIARAREQVQIPKNSLIAIGWMKSWLILRWAKKSQKFMPTQEFTKSLDGHLEIAGQQGITVRKLRALLNGEPFSGKQNCVLLYFSGDDFETYKKAILTHGGNELEKGVGLVRQEQAILKIIATASTVKAP